MDVVGHDQSDVCVPNFADVSMFDGFQYRVSNGGICQEVSTALLAADGDKIILLARVDPKRHGMR
jgi:hypothetical protein